MRSGPSCSGRNDPVSTCCYRAESAGRPDEARGLDDGIDAAVKLHLSIHAAHRSLLGGDHRHLHLPVVDQGVQDGLDVIHGQINLNSNTVADGVRSEWKRLGQVACDVIKGGVTLLIPSSQIYFQTSCEVAKELFLWTIGLCLLSLAASA